MMVADYDDDEDDDGDDDEYDDDAADSTSVLWQSSNDNRVWRPTTRRMDTKK